MEVTVPAHLSHTGQARRATKGIDACIAPIVKALNAAGIRTAGSCCGHGRDPGNIILADGRELVILPGAEQADGGAPLARGGTNMPEERS